MKTFFLTALLLIFSVVTVHAAPVNLEEVKINYGNSKIFSRQDIDDAVQIIADQFGKWEGCKLHNIRYYGDDVNNQENLDWLNNLSKARNLNKKFTQCIAFVSDFYVSKDAADKTTFEPDSEYKDWQWWLARANSNEDWYLLTFGY